MNRAQLLVLVTAVVVGVLSDVTRAGKLDSFENSVSGARSSSGSSADSGTLSSFEESTYTPPSGSGSHSSGHSYFYGDCWYCRYHHRCLFHDGYFWHPHSVHPPTSPSMPGPGGTNDLPQVKFEPIPGSPLLPLARVDVTWQSVEEDVEAWDYALEVGYSAVAIRGRWTRYEEDDPGDTLDLSSLLLLWRIPVSHTLEMDAGLGAAELDGNDTQSGFDVSLAVRGWMPERHLGVEYRGEFMDIGTGVDSNDLSLLLHLRAFAIRCGYRWVHTSGNSLDGPFVGAALSF